MGWLNRFGISQLKAAAESVLVRAEDDAHADLYRHLGALFRAVLAGDAPLTDRDYEAVRFVLRDRPEQEAAALIDAMRQSGAFRKEEAIAVLSKLSAAERRGIIRIALELGIGASRQAVVHDLLQELAVALGMTGEAFADLEKQLAEADIRRRKLLRSGAGIGVALIIILIFILTATLLRSVIFGLIAAYVMLPVEKFFERRLSKPGTLFSRVYGFFSIFRKPLAMLADALQRDRRVLTPEEKKQRERSVLITRSVFMTSLVVLVIALAGTVFFTSLSSRYVHHWQAVRAEKAAAAPVIKTGDVRRDVVSQAFAAASGYVEKLRERFGETPVVRGAITAVSKVLTDEASQQEVMKFLLRRTGGMFAFTANLLGSVCNLLADVLLTVFFFLLFLSKLAGFYSSDKGGWREEYLVRAVFRSAWLPGAGEGTLLEAQRILSEILNRLKIWLKGYLMLVLVDATVYTTVFWFLNVPYFFILGPLAGCGILLPYIGPILSCCLTLLVTLATGGDAVSSGMLLSILAAYLIYNGIIEQFILYPMVIGESLGLTTLETIIVVLLGAIFAGIAGMLFAIPAASVLKYLVPQIYHCFDRRKDEGA